jgi:hypothetical protein
MPTNTTTAGRARPARVVLPEMPNHMSNALICELARQKKMGETPIILLPVVAPGPHAETRLPNRTPSDFVIVAIFQDKRKPQGEREGASALVLAPIG